MSRVVADMMTRELCTVTPVMTLTEMDKVLIERGVSGAPVVDGEKLVGVVSRADVVRVLYAEQEKAQRLSGFYSSPYPIGIPTLEHLARDSHQISERMLKLRVADAMSPAPITIGPTESLQAAAKLMSSKGIHRLPVVDGSALVGILSALDIVRLVGKVGLAH